MVGTWRRPHLGKIGPRRGVTPPGAWFYRFRERSTAALRQSQRPTALYRNLPVLPDLATCRDGRPPQLRPVWQIRGGARPPTPLMRQSAAPAEMRCPLLPPRLSATETHRLMEQMRTADRHYSVGHINARSLAPRLNEVCHLLHSGSLEILCISETWLSESVLDAVLLVPGYELYRCDRRGGGVAVLVSDDLRVSRLHDSSDGDPGVEALCLSVGGAGRTTMVVGAVYRPPGVLSARLCVAVRGQFESALATGKPVYVLGDFNVNLLSPDTADSRNF